MRKALHMILVLLVLISTGGVTVYHHYCNGLQVKTTIDHSWRCCGAPCKHCHNKSVTYKIHDQFATSSGEVVPDRGTPRLVQFAPMQLVPGEFVPSLSPKLTVPHSPPFLCCSKSDSDALLQVFRI